MNVFNKIKAAFISREPQYQSVASQPTTPPETTNQWVNLDSGCQKVSFLISYAELETNRGSGTNLEVYEYLNLSGYLLGRNPSKELNSNNFRIYAGKARCSISIRIFRKR
jgi:hypothetical protein